MDLQHNRSDKTKHSKVEANIILSEPLPYSDGQMVVNADRFWANVDICGPDECWNWIGYRAVYGQFKVRIDGQWKIRGAHQVAYFLTHGPMPKHLEVLHSCDNAICCNPDHLRRGTRSENLRDAARKGRCHPKPRFLTEERVRQIKIDLAAGLSGRQVAAKNNITPQHVNDIKHGKSWAQVQI